MSTQVWLTTVVSDVVPAAVVYRSSPPDPSCNVSEVARLLWTVIVLAAVNGLLVVARPTWRRALSSAGAAAIWTWIDMEGPVLVARGSHGIHLADVPVALTLLAVTVAVLRLLTHRYRHPS